MRTVTRGQAHLAEKARDGTAQAVPVAVYPKADETFSQLMNPMDSYLI